MRENLERDCGGNGSIGDKVRNVGKGGFQGQMRVVTALNQS